MMKVDTLLHNLKEIQQEKSCLENKLHEQRARRRGLEQELETTKDKLQQVKDVHTKMTETLKVAQHKVIQTQTQANSIEEANQERRMKIAEKNEKIEAIKQKQMEEIKIFEEHLADLASNLVAARKFYDDESLNEKITATENKKQQIEDKAEDFCKEMMILESKFEEIQLQQNALSDDLNDSGIDMDTRKTLRSLLLDENGKAFQALQEAQTDLQAAKELLLQLDK